MGLAARLLQRRASPRKMIRLLPGPIIDTHNTVVQCRPVDISHEGLSILSEAMLSVGDHLILKTHKDSVALEVIWWKQDFGKQGLSRYGLKATDPSADLEKIFEDAGCMKTS